MSLYHQKQHRTYHTESHAFSVYDQEETLVNRTCLYIFKSDHMSLFMLYHLGLILKKIVTNFSVSLSVHHVF